MKPGSTLTVEDRLHTGAYRLLGWERQQGPDRGSAESTFLLC